MVDCLCSVCGESPDCCGGYSETCECLKCTLQNVCPRREEEPAEKEPKEIEVESCGGCPFVDGSWCNSGSFIIGDLENSFPNECPLVKYSRVIVVREMA